MENKKWTLEEIDFLRNNYGIMSPVDIAFKIGRTRNAIKVKANKLGLKRPDKYTYNHSFFENIDTEHKAYWLGFIYADGYIHKAYRNHELGIELKKSDYEHLKKFNKCIDGNVEVIFRKRNDIRDIKTEGICSIRLYSKKIVDDLIAQGVQMNKSTIIQFPSFSNKELTVAFIRGFFDGDGCIMRNKNRKCLSANFASASLSFIQDLRGYLYNELGISSYIVKEKRRTDGVIKQKTDCYRLYINGMENSYIFCSILYQNATMYLDRKYNLFFEIVDEYKIIDRITKHHKTNRVKHADCLSK